MLSKERAYALIDIIGRAAKMDTVVVIMHEDMGLTRFANSEIHQNMAKSDTFATITVFDGEKLGSVTTNVLEENALISALRSAEAMLPFLQPSGMLFEPLKDMPSIESSHYDPSFDQIWSVEARALAIGEQIDKTKAEYSVAGAFEVAHKAIAWGNNYGVKRYSANSQAHLEVMISHPSGASGFSDIVASKANSLDLEGAFDFARSKAEAGLNAVVIEPGVYDVVLEPLATGDLMGYTSYLSFNSKMHQDNMSPLTGKMGTQVFSPLITIEDDYTLPEIGGLPFDFEGYPRSSMTLIDKGRLVGLTYDTHTAKKEGLSTTGHSLGYSGQGGLPFYASIAAGESTLENLIAGVKRGLLVSRFHYMNGVDYRSGLLTALTRDGLFLIEDGRITGAVRNLRFTDSIERIFTAVDGVTQNRIIAGSFGGSCLVPGLRVRDFHFTGGTTLE